MLQNFHSRLILEKVLGVAFLVCKYRKRLCYRCGHWVFVIS